ncbi:MAG TPA: DNA translocase FtsK 4TM domain-containing protein [Acidimicrobiia bacterium]|nr:DNA translocase FtsK 4TM domain-containing protein [Acidimicrobiia bacterium]
MAKKTPARRGTTGRKRVSSKRTTNRAPTNRAAPSRAGKSRAGKSRVGKTERTVTLATVRNFLRDRLGGQADDVWGLVLLVTATLVTLSFFGQAGPAGRWIDLGLGWLFGVWAYAIPPILVGVGLVLALGRRSEGTGRLALGALAVFIGSLAMFHLLTGAVSLAANVDLVEQRGGAVGALLSFPLRRLLGIWGAFVILTAVIAMGVLVVTRTSVRELVVAFGEIFSGMRRLAGSVRVASGSRPALQPRPRRQPRHAAPKPAKRVKPPAPAVTTPAAAPRPPAQKTVVRTDGTYQLPPLELLEFGGGEETNRRALEDTARDLEETLHQHGVDAQLTKIVPGPTVTRYEVELAPGVKVNRVSNLAHDIAYALATPDVRLLVPIPGKSAIGVEVPNRKRRLVSLGDILRSPEATREKHPLTVAVGMDISGMPMLLNLSELPHVLIAGATGAGKSSCINSLVTSLLVRTTPDDVRLIMVDPKRVELGQYNGAPHLLTRVITNPKKANDALKWAVAEMDRRYDLLADAKVRDIDGYREKLDVGGLDTEQFDRFPYIVILVDELNDLMMVAGREVEESIVRIAQMARAVGIHLVLATQRPSVNVITGVIKANVPSRLAFSVASQTDSRVILDSSGAEKLVGMGDMLVVTAKEPRPRRIQGAFVRETEIHAVVDWVKAQREAQYKDQEVLEVAQAASAAAAEVEDDAEEAIVRQAMELIVRNQLGSTSMLQRKLRIGFARAGRVMDILETRGVVGPSVGSKARDVLMTIDELDELLAGVTH